MKETQPLNFNVLQTETEGDGTGQDNTCRRVDNRREGRFAFSLPRKKGNFVDL